MFAIGSSYPFAAFPFVSHFGIILVMGIFFFHPNVLLTVREKFCSGKEEGEEELSWKK